MRLSSTADSLDKIANLGSTENISRKLIVYKKCNCKIIAIEKATAGNNGKLILEGNADSTVDGMLTNADVIILTTRTLEEASEITLGVQPSYSSTNKVTTVTIPTTATVRAEHLDIGGYVCKKYDLTSYIAKNSFGQVSGSLEDGFGSAGSSTLTVTLDNVDAYFFSRKNKTGLFYSETKLTKISKISHESSFSLKHELYTTKLALDAISANFTAAQHVGSNILFSSGKAAGKSVLVIDDVSSDNEFEVIGFLAPNYYDSANYHVDVKIDDMVCISHSNEFFFRLEIGLLSEPTERVDIVSGQLDLSNLQFLNADTQIVVSGYSFEKRLDEQQVGNIDFNSTAIKLTKLNEMNIAHYEPAYGNFVQKAVKKIERSVNTDFNFCNVAFVAYNVIAGWHILDVIPNLGLYRFNFGKWTRIKDSYDFEANTQSCFLADAGGEIPDHATLGSPNEKLFHGRWIQLSFQTQDSTSVGVSGTNYSGASSSRMTSPQKITGLPTEPTRYFFRMSDGVGLNVKQLFMGRLGYSFDGGEVAYPEIYPQVLLTRADAGSFADRSAYILASSEYMNVWQYDRLAIGSFKKFNGIQISFLTNTFVLIAPFLNHLALYCSVGGNVNTAGAWSGNLSPHYYGGVVAGVTSQTVFDIGTLSTNDEVNGMYLKAVSGWNFGLYRKIVDSTAAGVVTIESAFPNAVGISDQFEVINKNIIAKIKDFGEMFRGGDSFDAAFGYGIGSDAGTAATKWRDYRELFYEKISDGLGDYEDVVELGNCIYLGSNSPFNNICMTFDDSLAQTTERIDIGKMNIEYWDGEAWVPTSETSIYKYEDYTSGGASALSHHIVSFKCENWVKRTATDIYASASNADSNFYYIRIKTDNYYKKELVKIILMNPSNLSFIVTWNDLPNWNKNIWTDANCLDYGTLNTIQQDIEFYFVQLDVIDLANSSRKTVDIRLIERLSGHSADSLFAYFDMDCLDENSDSDYIQTNDCKINKANVIPRISTDKFLIQSIPQAIGVSERNSVMENFLKNKIDYARRQLNLVGNFPNLVKVIPAQFIFDTAQYFDKEDVREDLTNPLCVCVIKDRGQFRMFVLTSDAGGTVNQYTSPTGKTGTWSIVVGVALVPAGDYGTAITWISVVKDYEGAAVKFHIYLVGNNGVNPDRIFHVSFVTWGTYTDENAGNPVLSEGGGGTWDAGGIVDCCVITGSAGFNAIYYTGKNAGGTQAIGHARCTDNWTGNTWTKDATNPLLQIGAGGQWDDTKISSPTVIRSESPALETSVGYTFTLLYYVGENSGGTRKIGVAIQGRGAAGIREFEKYSGNPISAALSNLLSIAYCYESYYQFMFPYSHDFLQFYLAFSGTVNNLYEYKSVDGFSFVELSSGGTPAIYTSIDYRNEFGVFDEFVSDQLSIELGNDDSEVLIVGFREPFSTVDLVPTLVETTKKLNVQYWNGTAWANLYVHQFGSRSYLVENKVGFFFDPPVDWQPVDMGYLVDNLKISSTYAYLKRNTQSLYMIKLARDSASSPSVVKLKRAVLCKECYIIADKYNVWILKEDGILEHKLNISKLFMNSNDRFEIVDISFDPFTNDIEVTARCPSSYAYNIDATSLANRVARFRVNIFDQMAGHANLGLVYPSKDNSYIYRLGSEVTNDNSKKIMLIGQFSDSYVDNLTNN